MPLNSSLPPEVERDCGLGRRSQAFGANTTGQPDMVLSRELLPSLTKKPDDRRLKAVKLQ
jgi:hypothetical protein